MNKNIIEENSQIPELYVLRHKHDMDLAENGYDYNSNILINTVSPVLYRNPNTSLFVDYLSKMLATLHDSVMPVRNLFFYSHSKYYNKHGK